MNLIKHMEAVFVAALAFAGSLSYVVETLPQAQAHVAAPAASSVAATSMPVVIVSAKRMTEAEKRASLQAERAGSKA
ncbi:hypothetical protein NX773_15640 [Massilia solisilvae]|uniref:Uncharacterized protein n=1 Tax=Massilia solisilvae TaxID=1811225 RepID=A0ABT2BNF0_9BURK|nr:hypothetical protein [Massilia solisilvae]MCS0609600.1 hypothetical protein [Massilia solisilvae]